MIPKTRMGRAFSLHRVMAVRSMARSSLEITSSKLLAKPWLTTRTYYRQRARKYEIVEGVCEQGRFIDAKDADGNDTFAPITFHDNVPVGSKTQ